MDSYLSGSSPSLQASSASQSLASPTVHSGSKVTQNKGKEHVQSNSSIECFSCHSKGHITSQCPNRALALNHTPADTSQDTIVVVESLPPEDCKDVECEDANVLLLSGVEFFSTGENDGEQIN